MKTIGILGGMSAEATAEYYRAINDGVRAALGGHSQAEMVILSVNFAHIEHFIRTEDWGGAGAYLAERARQVEAAGADCLFLATNTMHRVRETIKKAISIPFIDIFDVTAEEIVRAKFATAGLLGTYPAMTDAFYTAAFGAHGIKIISPAEDVKREIDRVIFDELCRHTFTEASKRVYIQAIHGLAAEGAECVILGCTEIGLLISQEDVPEIPLFDTTAQHCRRAVALALGNI